MDISTKELWFQQSKDNKVPSLKDVYGFLELRATALSAGSAPAQRQRQPDPVRLHAHLTQQEYNNNCPCNQQHRLYKCNAFLDMSPFDRTTFVKENKYCTNCLAPQQHHSSTCTTSACKVCNKKHHTMLHYPSKSNPNRRFNQAASENANRLSSSNISSNHCKQSGAPPGFLGTALVQIRGPTGKQYCRALLDGCSEGSFITADCVKRLGLRVNPSSASINGVMNSAAGTSSGSTRFTITPHYTTFPRFDINAFIVAEVSSHHPKHPINRDELYHTREIQLADPQFDVPSSIDILIGAELFWELLENDTIRGRPYQPIATKTALGWVIAGRRKQNEIMQISSHITNIQLNDKLEMFWQSDTIPESQSLTKEERECETHFTANVSRTKTGRFITPIPWKSPRPELGDSKAIALRRFQSMERRLSNPKYKTYKEEYVKFMKEYEALGHMQQVPPHEVSSPLHSTYFIPHHFVLKEDSTTTKFRVVFDASAKSTNGTSLNDCMMVGPTIQSSLFEILLRFRMNRIAFTADVAKMYRQILIPTADQDLHRILWREKDSDPIKEYKLQTVTYGTASAPYLATRVLQQLAHESRSQFPLASKVALKDFYVDDLISGSDDIATAKHLYSQLNQMLSSAEMSLRKWTTSSSELRSFIPDEVQEKGDAISFEDHSVKTLGIHWNPYEDNYRFTINLPESNKFTKRLVLSDISSIFDPVGWLAPVILNAKFLMKKLWKCTIDWDQPIPNDLAEEWQLYKSSLKLLEKIRIPRYVLHHSKSTHLIGFSDASEQAYAAVIYIYSEVGAEMKAELLTSKTRVAPSNSTTLPRLELNAAALLAELMGTVQSTLDYKFTSVRAYTDSTIALAWIKSDPNRWKTYVRNRVIKVQENLLPNQWYHINGPFNPADCASRGLATSDLISHTLWWNATVNIFSRNQTTPEQLMENELNALAHEERSLKVTCAHITLSTTDSFIHYFSSYKKLIRTTAIFQRFFAFLRSKKTPTAVPTGVIDKDELIKAESAIIRFVQQQCFKKEIDLLSKQQQLPASNKLLSLSPFMKDYILRVGGRLRNAAVNDCVKHPVLLPRSHHITNLIIQQTHHELLHAGAQATLADLNQRFWIVRGRDAVRHQIRKCVSCTRQRAETLTQIMGNLPEARVNPSRPFSNCGVDYAGPFPLKNYGRSKVNYKCWLVLFVCFATRAIHLEIATSLSTEGFMAAFRRFIARRGKPLNMFSDCGTNFVGANRTIESLQDAQQVASNCASQGVKWHFNPPGAPHFGGLWEAGVKSVKHHLRRVMGPQSLTYEEMSTLVIQIEGILNSRPLTPVSTNPEDLEVLTPAHFLIGTSITALPEDNLEDIKINRLTRWQLIQQKQQQFWTRWQKEFITRMQQRPKWMNIRQQLQVGDIVLIKEDNAPPASWKLGRVLNTHNGTDDITRVVTLKTQQGEIRRAITKLCLLPINPNPQDEG